MFSSNQNIDKVCTLILDIKKYIELKGEYLQVDLVCKLSRLFTILIVAIILFAILFLIVIFSSLTIAELLNLYIANRAISYGILVIFYILLTTLVYVKRKAWIEKPVTNFMAHIFMDKRQ